MSRFKIGQKVVALKNGVDIRDGNIYTVQNINHCCTNVIISLVEITDDHWITRCTACRKCHKGTWINETCFAPLQNNADAIEYRLNVSEPEMEALKLKEVQHQ